MKSLSLSLSLYLTVDEHSEIQLTAQSASGCVFPQCQEEETLRKLWNKNISLILGNTLKQYQIPIEHCLHKWHIFYLLTVSVLEAGQIYFRVRLFLGL